MGKPRRNIAKNQVLPRLPEGGEMATLLEARAREWERQWYREGRAEGIERGMERGRAEERARLYHRLAARKFGAETAQRLSELLGRIPDDGPAAEVGEWIIECETGTELLDRAERASGPPPPERPKNASQSTALRDERHHRGG